MSPTARRQPQAATGPAAAAPRPARSPRRAAPGSRRGQPAPVAATPATNGDCAAPAITDGAAWRAFVGRWLEAEGCGIGEAARGDWEVALSPALQRRWRRQRVRLVFDPQRPTLPRGAWFTAPGSAAGRKILEAAREQPTVVLRTAMPRVPGAPENGLASVCRVRGLTWGPPRLGPVGYERRTAFHVVITLWGSLPAQESWVLLLGPDGRLIEREPAAELPEVRARDGLYQGEPLAAGECEAQSAAARAHLERLLDEREREWEAAVGRLRDDELARLSAFFAARVEEEEERSRRRGSNGDEHEMEGGDVVSLKLEWERRAAEVRGRWALRTEVRMWGVAEWAWPVLELEQELRAGAVHVRLTSRVDVARGRPELPACPGCGAAAEMLVRTRGSIGCVRCAP
jgi:hypothetical protein